MSFEHNTPLPPMGGSFPTPYLAESPLFARFDPSQSPQQPKISYTGEALARDSWGERYGTWFVLGFTVIFTVFLLGMLLGGEVPGKSFPLKAISDILQFCGEGIGLIFCIRISLRLYRVSIYLRHDLIQKSQSANTAPNELASARTQAQSAGRSFWAWTFLTIAVLLYASGQAIWTSYDIRMTSLEVPYPGFYDIGFVASYLFFLLGTLFLTRRNKATVGRVRLLLDALAVIGATLALSWFFVLSPSINSLSNAPSQGAAFLSVYFPTGDLFLVAIGAFLMFSPLSNRSQQPVLFRLCLGLFSLAITDSLLGYYNLAGGFNTGTIQDVLWPLSMCLIGLAAIEYPRSIAFEQEQNERQNNPQQVFFSQRSRSNSSQLVTTLQTISPFILVLITCTILLTVVAPQGGAELFQADLVALVLILIVIMRQALTLIENNRLTMQMRGELVISRRELQVTRREADEASRTAQEKTILEEGIGILRSVHARVARGDLGARAPTISGPLLPIAISLNLMLDRLSHLTQRGLRYDQLIQECRILQDALERMNQGQSNWSEHQQHLQKVPELRSIFMSLIHLQRLQGNQWRRLLSTLETMSNLTKRFRETLNEIRNSALFTQTEHTGYERMLLDRLVREADMLDQLQQNVRSHAAQGTSFYDPGATIPGPPSQIEQHSFSGLEQGNSLPQALPQTPHIQAPLYSQLPPTTR